MLKDLIASLSNSETPMGKLAKELYLQTSLGQTKNNYSGGYFKWVNTDA